MSSGLSLFAVDGDPNLTQTSAHGEVFLWLEALRQTGTLHRPAGDGDRHAEPD